MSAKNLLKTWSLPDRGTDRSQLTLRLPFTEYAKLHALKSIYPNRNVNDMICDILKTSLDEIIEALPSYTYTEKDLTDSFDGPACDPWEVGSTVGLRVNFDNAYRQILEKKSDNNSQEEAA